MWAAASALILLADNSAGVPEGESCPCDSLQMARALLIAWLGTTAETACPVHVDTLDRAALLTADEQASRGLERVSRAAGVRIHRFIDPTAATLECKDI